MEGEIQNYIKAWVQVILSLSYSYFITKLLPKGIPTLLPLLPVIFLFLSLPLSLHSLFLSTTFSFFISWLATFKLLLFAFHKGPLSHLPSLSLLQFILIASLPITIPKHPYNNKSFSFNKYSFLLKSLVFLFLLKAYRYAHSMHLYFLLSLYCIHIYLVLEAILVFFALLAQPIIGIQPDQPFDRPYLSTSLRDYWGRRWNLVVTKILRPAVYEPVFRLGRPRLGPEWASLLGVLATFLVSGLMHELIFYYVGRVKPTWEVTWFFLLHGFCLVVETGLKMALTDRFRLPRVVSMVMTAGFVWLTAFWLFFPQLLRFKCEQRVFEEYAAVSAFVKNVGGAFAVKVFNALRYMS